MRRTFCIAMVLAGWLTPAAASAQAPTGAQVVEVHAADDVQLLWLHAGDHLLLGRVPYRYPGGPAIVARLDDRILYVNGRPAGADLIGLSVEQAHSVLAGYKGTLPGIAIDSHLLPSLAKSLAKRGVRALALGLEKEHRDLRGLNGLAAGLQALWIKGVRCDDDACFRDGELSKSDWTLVGGLRELRYLYTDSGPITGLAQLARLKKLERLVLADELFTDAAMPHVAALTQLRALDLSRTEITAAGFAGLATLRNLRRIDLSNGEPSNATAGVLAKLTALEEIDIGGADISDAGIAQLARLPNLRALDASATTLTTAGGLAAIGSLAGLRRLHLGEVELSAESYVHLAKLANLEWLDLGQTKTSPLAIKSLHGLVRLQMLRLGSGGMTDAHIKELWAFTGLKALLFACDSALCCSESTTAGLEGIERLADLRLLVLRAGQLNDAGMLRLRELKALRKLALVEDSCYADDFEITDAGLLLLLPLDHLWVLQLPHSKAEISEEGVLHFKTERPGCQISWIPHEEP